MTLCFVYVVTLCFVCVMTLSFVDVSLPWYWWLWIESVSFCVEIITTLLQHMELLPLLLIAELWLFDLLLDRVSQFLVLGRTTTKGTSLATFEHFRLDTMEWRHESQ